MTEQTYKHHHTMKTLSVDTSDVIPSWKIDGNGTNHIRFSIREGKQFLKVVAQEVSYPKLGGMRNTLKEVHIELEEDTAVALLEFLNEHLGSKGQDHG